MVTLLEIEAAQARISNYIRHTPLVEAQPVREPACNAKNLYLKLENMQVTGSFKVRGATNKVLSLRPDEYKNGIITASGGNHGLGVAYAGWLKKIHTTIYLPKTTPEPKIRKLEKYNAKVVISGSGWDEANQAALEVASKEGLAYIHPFADPAVVCGQGTISLEILEKVPDIDVLVIAIGGGGLISGMSIAAKTLNPHIKIIGVEPVGAPTLYESIKAGHVVELGKVETKAGTLAPRKSTELNFDIIRKNVDDIVLVSDEEMVEGARWLWDEMSTAAEMSGAAALAALLTGKIHTTEHQNVCALVCGMGRDGIER